MTIAWLQNLTDDCSLFPQRLVYSLSSKLHIAAHSDDLQHCHFYVTEPLSQHTGLRA